MLNIVISIIAYDIWFYISHLLLHSKYLYKYHKEHHTKIVPTFLDTYVAHPFESPFQGIGMFFPYAVINYTAYETIVILVLLNIRGTLQHDERGAFLVGNHHLIHHRYQNCNYGQYWIDALMSTGYLVPSAPRNFNP